jgi:uncharacterized SAM-binding protein YcdF (DUF218 family)
VIARRFALLCRLVGALVVMAFALGAFTRMPNTLAQRIAVPAAIARADAIVVLGASINRDGTLTDASLRRAVEGIRLYREGLAPRLLVLGMYGEGRARAELAATLGVPREAVTVDEVEPTTRHEAHGVAQRLKPQGATRILLVTDTLHMRRARGLFERAGFTVFPAPTQTGLVLGHTPENRLRLTRGLLQELTALAYHRAFGYL